MGMSTGGNDGYASEINITPLVDVVLVLLIIFMVIVPVMLRGYDVDVPGEVAAPPPGEVPEQIVMTIDIESCPVLEPLEVPGPPADCVVRINQEAVAVPELPQRLAVTYADREGADRTLFLAANDRLNYEGVMRILDVAKSGVDDLRIGIVTEQ
jgi:biopolymer transport protein ExbD